MIELIFTLDYEIYGNGYGSLKEQIIDPCSRMLKIFNRYNMKMVVFVETAELEIIQQYGTDPAISEVREQLAQMHNAGHEIALHLHPQWYNASLENGWWCLDYNEYNLCVLPKKRISEIVDRGIGYLQKLVPDSGKPTSFRAGNWLFQPSATLAKILSQHGILIDSSVFKGGLQHQHSLDYRQAMRNSHYWQFIEDICISAKDGLLTEIPIYTRMVPFWKMLTKKRRSFSKPGNNQHSTIKLKSQKMLDRTRLFYPLKLDFCRMTINELVSMIDYAVKKSTSYQNIQPVVAIGHTKDFYEEATLDAFMKHLINKNINVSTFREISNRL